jgi:hypothetical protein
VVEAVVALGDQEEEPEGEDFTRSERALPVQRGGEVPIQGGRQLQTPQGGPQDGQVADVGYHPEMLSPGGADICWLTARNSPCAPKDTSRLQVVPTSNAIASSEYISTCICPFRFNV